MSRIIIGIHGLGNKPEKKLLEKWWKQSITDGLKKIDKFKFEPKFEIVYWADILNDKPLNILITDTENPYYLDEPYTAAVENLEHEEHSIRKRFLGFLEEQMDKIFLNDDLTPNFEFISEIIFKKYFKELNIYYADELEVSTNEYQSIKEIIRNRLTNTLRKHKGKKILLIAHSMGSIIAYDVCNITAKDISINTLATVGSPLGIPIIIGKIAEELKESEPTLTKLRTPENITKRWVNFADVEDNVALNYNLADDFEANSALIKVQDIVVENDYSVEERRNPHKSYGYLRTPEFANLVADFLEEDTNTIFLWFKKQWYLLSKFFHKINPFSKGDDFE